MLRVEQLACRLPRALTAVFHRLGCAASEIRESGFEGGTRAIHKRHRGDIQLRMIDRPGERVKRKEFKETRDTSFFSHGNTEWDTDLLFKKPWTLSDKVEFMFGVGPEWVHTTGHGSTNNSVSSEVVLDFMFWPSSKHRFGWYLEPSYGYDFGRGHEQSLGMSAGLLIAIPGSKR